ncbi:hypothetical protein V1514DRAFT_279083 [Lipomyces japonicus]|uniref:uncharacterized protein n=1 Tax=Lipomyces japonicus TaxID=56871 RepID=UPI0034CF3960
MRPPQSPTILLDDCDVFANSPLRRSFVVYSDNPASCTTEPAGSDNTVSDLPTHTTVVMSRPTILSEVSNSSILNRRVSLQVPNSTISLVDLTIWRLLHRVDTYAFPPSIATVKSSLLNDYAEHMSCFLRTENGREYSSDLVKLIAKRMPAQLKRFLDILYGSHAPDFTGDCDSHCFAGHIYNDLNVIDQRDALKYLQFAALWRRIAEEIDMEGPHACEEWWYEADLKFKLVKARMRYSGVDEEQRYLQNILDND